MFQMIQIAEDSFDILAAPVKVATEVVAAGTKPIAEGINEVVDDVRDALRD